MRGPLSDSRPYWPGYRAVWRWHFYAGLFCVPFILWLSATGAIYLFRPQIEDWLDRPYENLSISGVLATPEEQVMTAVAAVPGSNFHYYELPRTSHSAARVIVGKGAEEYRVYVHPQTLRVLKVINEDKRPMRIVFHLHGELMAGDWGSRLVELAASWAIVMILTGLYLWWPRQSEKLAGVLWVRLNKGKRILWRDLHAVTGVWVSSLALFLLLTGLPWAKGWGGYLKLVRSWGAHGAVQQDWPTGRSSEIAQRMAMDHHSHAMGGMVHDYSPLNRLVPAAASLRLAYPVQVSPPMDKSNEWIAKSDAQNRTLRATVKLDPMTGAVLWREDFRQRSLVDRIVGIGVAAHEGQLFGLANQMLGLFTALALATLSISAVVLWWRRRETGVLGAPSPGNKPRWSAGFAVTVIALAVYLPAMGVSLVAVFLLERFVLSRIPPVSRWLGLAPAQPVIREL